MAKAPAKDDAHLEDMKKKIDWFKSWDDLMPIRWFNRWDLISQSSDATNHIVDASEDDGGKLGSVAPLRDEGEGEGVHKQLMTYSQIIANMQLVFNFFAPWGVLSKVALIEMSKLGNPIPNPLK